jgi:hypothetical protein
MEKIIKIVDVNNNVLFYIRDGGWIRIGKIEVIVHYVDDEHFRIVNTIWNAIEFAKKIINEIVVPLKGLCVSKQEEDYSLVYIPDIDKIFLFSDLRIGLEFVPKNLYRYEIRQAEVGVPYHIKDRILINHFGILLTKEELFLGNDGIYFKSFNFIGKRMTTKEYSLCKDLTKFK